MRVTGKALGVALAICLPGSLVGTAANEAGLGKRAPATPAARMISASGAAKRPVHQPYIWRNVEIVGGGFVSGILFSPRQPNLIYARTDIGGAYRWNPAARRWVSLLDWLAKKDWNLYGIESIGIDPTDADRVYLATGTYTNEWGGNGAILRSTDQGRTWLRTDMPFKMGGNENGRSIGERLAVDPNKNSILYFGSRNDGLWTSADYGATWNRVNRFPITGRTNGVGIGFIVFDRSSGQKGRPTPIIYVGVAAPGVTLYRSADGGATWEAVPGQPQGLLPHHGVLDKAGTLYLTYGSGPGPNGMSDGAVWKYTAKSGAWTDITPLVPGSEGAGRFGYAGLAVDAQHPGTVMVATLDRWNPGDTLYRTTDGGAHWTDLGPKSMRDSSASPFVTFGANTAKLGWWMGALAIDPFHPGHVLYGTGATIWGSDDVTAADHHETTHWTVRAQGLEETAVIDLISPPAGAHLISALGDIGGFRHDDLTVSPRAGVWTNPFMSNTDSLDFAQRDPALMVRVGRGAPGKNGAYSVDGGATWKPFESEPPNGRGGGSVAISADGSAILWATRDGGPSVSTDRGATWKPCTGAPATLRVVADRVNPRKFYAIAARADRLYISIDGGASFAAGTQTLFGEHGALRAAPTTEGDLWLPVRAGLYHSTDSGASFTKLENVQQADCIGFGKAAPGRDYPALFLLGRVNDSDGVFRSDDAGASWIRIDDARHQFATRDIIIGDPRIYGRTYIGTNGRGILYGEPARRVHDLNRAALSLSPLAAGAGAIRSRPR